MTFKAKMWMLPIATAVIVSIGISLNSRITATTSDNLKEVQHVSYPAVEALRGLKLEFDSTQNAFKQAVTEGDDSALSVGEEHAKQFRGWTGKLRNLSRSQEQRADKLGSEFDAYYTSALHATKIMLNKEKGDVPTAVGDMQAKTRTLTESLKAAQDDSAAKFDELLNQSGTSIQRTLTISIASAVLMIVALGIGSWFLITSVFRTLGGDPEQALSIVRRIAGGDFATKVDVAQGDTTSLLHGIGVLRSTLGALIRDVHGTSQQVDKAAGELTSSVGELNDRTASQAANLEETASSMEEMLATVKQNADNARNANEVAAAARSQAETGGRVVHRAVEAVSAIHESSRKIADIIGVIDEIAFQTNLLALNAAVEAARAGEQGRGFAVVATEVRNLAQRSATAAREIKELIQDSVGKVQDGATLVNESGKHLNDIVTATKRVAEIVGEIASASSEQSRGLEQVNQAVMQMDSMTQQNSAMSEETAAVAQSMSEQAKRLTGLVSRFTVEHSAARPESFASYQSAMHTSEEAHQLREVA
jgi:methyl-accepting chemotaxis protein